MNQQINFDVVQLQYLDALEIESVDWMSIVMLLFGLLLNRHPMLEAIFDVFLKPNLTQIIIFLWFLKCVKCGRMRKRKNITCCAKHYHAPPNGPTPSNKTKYQCKCLCNANKCIHKERSNTGSNTIMLRKSRYSQT